MKKLSNAQAIQEDLFRKMSAEKKLKIASSFFSLARKLNKLGKDYGTNKPTPKNQRHSRKTVPN